MAGQAWGEATASFGAKMEELSVVVSGQQKEGGVGGGRRENKREDGGEGGRQLWVGPEWGEATAGSGAKMQDLGAGGSGAASAQRPICR
jgi:hypothetical protein